MTGFAAIDRDHALQLLRLARLGVRASICYCRLVAEIGSEPVKREALSDLAHYRAWYKAELRRFVGAWGAAMTCRAQAKPAVPVDPLDRAWEQINALGGYATTPLEEAINETVRQALAIIEALGGMDPLQRRRPLDPPPSMRVPGGDHVG